MTKQKFFRGQRVRLAKDFGKCMSHFGGKGGEAIVVHSYSDSYGGGNYSDFDLLVLCGKPEIYEEYPSQSAWYHDYQMTLISDDRVTGEKILQLYNEFIDETGDMSKESQYQKCRKILLNKINALLGGHYYDKSGNHRVQ